MVSVIPGAESFVHDGRNDAGVLLCHGLTGSPQSMRPWGEYLAAEGFAVRCPRLPGHGTHWRELNQTTWVDWYEAVDHEFRLLHQQYSSVFVFGQSMGGTLALRLAQCHGADVAGLALVNPSVTTQRRSAILLPVLSRMIPSLPGVAGDIAKPGATELAYDRLPLRAAASLAKLWKTVSAELATVSQPLLLLHSAADHVVEPINATLVLERTQSTDVTDIVLPDSFHVATLDYDAPTLFARSLEFISRVLGQPLSEPL